MQYINPYDSLTRSDVHTIVFICVFAYVYSLILAPELERHGNNSLYRMNTSCFVECTHEKCEFIRNYRGKDYFNGGGPNHVADNERIHRCAITFFNFSHVFMHFLFGFIVPKYQAFYFTFVLGVVFELYEKYVHNCEDPVDIVCNTSGFWIGYITRMLVSRNDSE